MFQTTINDINDKMEDNQKSNQTLQKDNMELASKLQSLLEEYKTREEVNDLFNIPIANKILKIFQKYS